MLSFFVAILSYSIIRHGMFDIRAAAVRTLAYVMSLSVLVGMYYGLVIVISNLFLHDQSLTNQSPLGVGLALALLFVFQPIKKFFDRLTNRIFYRDYYDSNEFFAGFNKLLTSTTNLRSLLERAATEIATTLKGEQVFFFVNTLKDHYTIAGTEHHKVLSKTDIDKLNAAIQSNPDTLDRYNVIVRTLLDDTNPIHGLLTKHHIEIVVPLVRDSTIGYLFLGTHRTSRYTSRDIKVLRTVADELVIAIESALSIQAVRDANAASLQQRIDGATRELSASNRMLRRMDAEKNEFVSIASHELRTPMTVINGYTDLLQRGTLGKLNAKQKEIFDKISKNTKTLIKLVDDMLDLSNLESNKLEVQISDQPINQLIRESMDKVRLLYEAKELELVYPSREAMNDVIVHTDPDKFQRVMLNLLSNAQKFTDAGGKVTITASVGMAPVVVDANTANSTIGTTGNTTSSEDSQATAANVTTNTNTATTTTKNTSTATGTDTGVTQIVTISVIDTGVGIPPEAMNDLFKKFSQVYNYLQGKSDGTGLGLSICKQLVEKLGGNIGVESVVGRGSRFWFTVRVK
jgi:signal transduction histidine kinase